MLKNKKGFTLIEIVIVIVIIAILAAILVPSLISWVNKSELATFKSEADTVRKTVVAQITEENKDGVLVSDATSLNITTIDTEFWDNVSEAVNKTIQATDEDKDGYVKFTYSSGKFTEFIYASGGHKATLDGSNWVYE